MCVCVHEYVHVSFENKQQSVRSKWIMGKCINTWFPDSIIYIWVNCVFLSKSNMKYFSQND